MKNKELIKILKCYEPEADVSIVHWSEGTTISAVEMVAGNNGPSIYAEGWERRMKPKPEINQTKTDMNTTTSTPPAVQQRLVRLLVDADSLICVLENLTRGYQKHLPEDKDCWCNGCVHPRADEWQLLFRELCSELEANA